MIKIMFVCHGNICRSPMAEFVFKDLLKKRRLEDQFIIASSATSREEIGHPVHPGTRKILAENGISCAGKTSAQFKKDDYALYDYIVCMDDFNIRNLNRIIGSDVEGKVSRLLDFTGRPGDIADPWYTGDFDETYDDVVAGCEALLNYVMR